ncbi:helix-turn-helix domain-containing protein [Vibrio rotiferianus]|uniref:helix-turn-helix domain-containing protein n=1 Tax=Vibrio rotiferianus TaxID=190895 RepID=UPI00406A3EAF
MKQTFIPLIVSDQVITFIDVIKELGENHYQILHKTLLPENIEVLGSGFITREVVAHFFSAMDTTLPAHIKYQVIRKTAHRNAQSIVQIYGMKAAETLFEAISIFVNNVHGISTESTFELQSYLNKYWFICHRRKVDEPWFRFSETYVICLLIEIIRQLLGKQWTTSMIRIQSSTTYLEALPQPCKGLPVFSCKDGTGIYIAKDHLHEKRAHWKQMAKSTLARDENISLKSFDISLMKALTPYLCEGRISLRKAAKITHLTKRTLQRRLNDIDMTFSQLLDYTIEEEANRLLQRKEYTITQISYMLGYNTPAHFSRAFKRMTKLTPKVYRAKLTSNRM